MKKKIIISVVILLVLVVTVLGYAALNANSLIAKYKPELEKIASQSLGTKVTLGELDVSVFPRTVLKVKGFSLGKKENAESLSFNSLDLSLRLLPLLGGNLDITKLTLDSPSIVIIKNAAGIRIPGLPKKKKKKDTAKTPATDKPAKKPKESSGSLPISLALDNVSIENATLTFNDELKKKSYGVKDFDLATAVALDGNKATLNSLKASGTALDSIPLSINSDEIIFDTGSGELNLTQMLIKLSNASINAAGKILTKTGQGSIKVTSDNLSLSDLTPLAAKFSPQVETYKLAGALKPNLDISLEGAEAFSAKGDVGISDLAASVGNLSITKATGSLKTSLTAKNADINTDKFQFALNGQPAVLSTNVQKRASLINVNDIVLDALTGKTTGNFSLDSAAKNFNTKLTTTGVNLENTFKALKPNAEPPLSGTLENLSLNIGGVLGPELKNSLRGPISVKIVDGEIKGLNLAAKVLQAVTDLPFLSGSLYGSVPEDQKQAVTSKNTEIQSLTGNFNLANANLSTNNLVAISPIFRLESRGKVGFDKSVDLGSKILFSPEFSEAMADKTKELSKILDSQGRLPIPLRLSGKVPAVLVYPDLTELLKQAAEAAIRDKAGDLIGDVLGDKLGINKGKGKKRKKGGSNPLGDILGF